MYNDTIKAENKIISTEDLEQIFQMMGETLKKYKRISDLEEKQNQSLEYNMRKFTFKDEGSKIRVTVDFYDNTTITFDNYEAFMGIFYSRLEEIKTMSVNYSLNYTVMEPEPNKRRDFYMQSIQMYITDKKLDITLSLKSEDPKLDELYNFIKNKILNAPEKYDMIIKDKSKIMNTIAFAMGFIPGIIVTTLLLFVPFLNFIFFKGFVVYPLCVLFLTFIIGSIVATSKLDKYYSPILPDKISDGYDSNYHRVYKDDIDSFVGTSDILIGKKVNNIKNRKIIKKEYEKHEGFIFKAVMILIIASSVVMAIGFFIK